MSLLDDLKSVKPRKLSLPEWLIARTPEEREAFENSCADRAVPTDAIAAILRKHGGAASRSTLEEFRARVSTR